MNLKLTILPLCLIVLNAFAFEGTVKQTIANYNGTGATVSMTWYIAPHQCRIDVAASGKDISAGNTVIILDPAAQSLITYTTGGSGDKSYFRVSPASISGDAAVSVSKSNETKKISGYNCEKWTVTGAAGVSEIWITKEIDFDAVAYKEFFKSSPEVQALAQQGVRGFPIQSGYTGGSNNTTTESIAAKSIEAGTFQVPSDYKLFVPAQEKTPAKQIK